MPFRICMINPSTGKRIVVPNFTPIDGSQAFLSLMFQNDPADFAAGFFIGLCNQTPQVTDLLASITTEPTIGVNGYARQPIPHSAVGWPNILLANNVAFVRSQLVSFTASGGSFDQAFTRSFICNAATGTVGRLFAYSGPLNDPIILLDGQTRDFQFEYYLR